MTTQQATTKKKAAPAKKVARPAKKITTLPTDRLGNVMAWLTCLLPPMFFLSHAVADICCSVIALLFLVESYWRRDWQWCQQLWVKVGMGIWAYMVLRSFGAYDVCYALSISLPFIRFIVFAVALQKRVLCVPLFSERVFKYLTISTIIALLETLSQYAFGHGVISLLLDRPRFVSGRMSGPMSEARIGIMLTYVGFIMLVPYITRAMVYGKDHKPYWDTPRALLATLLSLLFVTTIFVSGERMAFILTSMGYGLLSLSIWRTVGKWLALVGLLKTLSVVGVFAVAGRHMVERQLISTWETLSHFFESSYGQLWLTGIDMGLKHPIFGIGPKQFSHFCPDYMRINPTEWCNLHAHNIYIEWFSELGLVGLVLFIFLLWRTIVWFQLKKLPELISNPLWLGLMITLLLRLFPLTANTSFFKNWAAVPLWFVIGWLFAISDQLPGKKVRGKR